MRCDLILHGFGLDFKPCDFGNGEIIFSHLNCQYLESAFAIPVEGCVSDQAAKNRFKARFLVCHRVKAQFSIKVRW